MSYSTAFKPYFRDYISSLNKSYVTYKVEPVTVDAKVEAIPEIDFNDFPSPDSYMKTLKRDFYYMVSDIENDLNQLYNKADKLFFLTRHTTELSRLQNLLVKDSTGNIIHKNFLFKNLSTETPYTEYSVTQNDLQEYYFWMQHYLDTALSFLQELKADIQATPQESFSLPASMLPDPDESHLNNPLAFFEFLFLRGGIEDLRNDFIPADDDYYHDSSLHYNRKTESKTSHEQDEYGEWEVYTTTFREVLTKRMYMEMNTSRTLMDEKIRTLKSVEEIKFFLSLLVTSLEYLLTRVTSDPEALKYEDCPKPLTNLLKYCSERYRLYCPQLTDETKRRLETNQSAVLKVSNTALLPLARKGRLEVFTVEHPYIEHKFSAHLYYSLVDNGFIDPSTKIEVFAQAFQGTAHDEPLKIRWTDTGRNGIVNKISLFHLLNGLFRAKCLREPETNMTLFNMMAFVFADKKGEPLKNLKISNTTALKKTKRPTKASIKLDDIIARIAKESLGKP